MPLAAAAAAAAAAVTLPGLGRATTGRAASAVILNGMTSIGAVTLMGMTSLGCVMLMAMTSRFAAAVLLLAGGSA
jgi:hypothetical protein